MATKKANTQRSAAEAGAKKATVTPPPADWRVRIRMHRQGVGDCFLITFRVDGAVSHILIDCGVLPGSPKEYNQLEAVAEAVRKEVMDNGGKLAALVATHEHADHVSAFEPGKKTAQTLDAIPVDEVWMAWTENPDDTIAKRLNGQLAMYGMAAAAIASRLQQAAKKYEAKGMDTHKRFGARVSRSAESIADILSNRGLADESGGAVAGRFALGIGLSAGSLGVKISTTVRAAMDHMKTRVTAGKFKKFLPGQTHIVPGIPAGKVRVFILGPPRIENLNKAPRHGKNDDIFHMVSGDFRAQARSLALAAGAAIEDATDDDVSSQPFPEETAKVSESSALKELQKLYRQEPRRQIDDDWLLTGAEFAMQLDSATNNTSLVLAIELVETGEVLLFPGDAQVENWSSWREVEWILPSPTGGKVTVKGEDLLRRTVFYKVGHHGSHNGTLDVHGLQLMPSDNLVAMCSVVNAVTSKRKGDWKEIPKPSLCEALKKKCGEGFLRMDAPKGELGGRLNGRVQETDLWVDYFLV